MEAVNLSHTFIFKMENFDLLVNFLSCFLWLVIYSKIEENRFKGVFHASVSFTQNKINPDLYHCLHLFLRTPVLADLSHHEAQLGKGTASNCQL